MRRGFEVEVRAGRKPRGAILHARKGATEVTPRFEIDGLTAARLWRDGFWGYINQTLDIFLDTYEEEDVSPQDVAQIAVLARSFASRYVGAPQRWSSRTAECLVAMSGYLEAAVRASVDDVRFCL